MQDRIEPRRAKIVRGEIDGEIFFRELRDVNARGGVVHLADSEIEASPGGFERLKSRMMQQSVDAFGERCCPVDALFLRRRMGARKFLHVLLKWIAATFCDLFEQAGGTKQRRNVGLRRGGGLRLGFSGRTHFQPLKQTVGMKIFEIANLHAAGADMQDRENIVDTVAIDGEDVGPASAEIAEDEVSGRLFRRSHDLRAAGRDVDFDHGVIIL